MDSNPKPCRRQFVKTLMFGTAASVLFGRPWRATVRAEPQPSPDVGVFRVKLSDYPPLQLDYGSVRLGFNPIDFMAPLGTFYPILINRENATTYYALDTQCSHAGCVVPPYDEAEGVIRCPCHGSLYALDGSLLGPPASNPLRRYPATFDGVDTLSIEIPGLAYSVTASVVQNGDASRFQLDFPTFESVEYEVQFRQRVRDPWTPVNFALAVDGPADQSSLFGNGAPATVYVDRATPTGFYTVSIKIIDLT